MANQQYPITPPPKLVPQWLGEHYGVVRVAPGEATSYVATQAAQWGADQELDACLKWVSENCRHYDDCSRPEDKLRAARRPKPPTLKERIAAAITAGAERTALSLLDEALPNG